MKSNISEHITYNEATVSDTSKRLSIVNDPNETQLLRMQNVANNIFEPLRKHFDTPINISSFFRSETLNKTIGGVKTSEHLLGQAMDIDADTYGKITNRQIFDYIRSNLNFNQLIDEGIGTDGNGGWVHCSYLSDTENKNEILQLKIKDGVKHYEIYKV
jgi:zinc D-Ala-D-Ala carboxypeptidase